MSTLSHSVSFFLFFLKSELEVERVELIVYFQQVVLQPHVILYILPLDSTGAQTPICNSCDKSWVGQVMEVSSGS